MINVLAHQVGEAVGIQIKIKHLPLPEDDPKQRQPIIERAKMLFDW